MTVNLKEVLEALAGRRSLSFEESSKLADSMLDGGLDDVGVAAVLVALRVKGEEAGEVAGFAYSLLRAAERVEAPRRPLLDTAGTGGDGAHTINASTAAAIVAASLGVAVAKHGNRGVSSKSGSADILEALGYPVGHGAREAECLLAKKGFTFLFAPRFHPAMKRVMPVRRKLGVRTVFNLAGPLSNPARPDVQVVGVAERSLLPVISGAARLLGLRKALVVHGEPGVDEVSVSGETLVIEVGNGSGEEYSLAPEDLGLPRVPLGELRVSSPEESAARVRSALEGRGRRGDEAFIAANAGAALYVAGAASGLRDGVEAALQAMREGMPARFLDEVVGVASQCVSGRG